MRMIIGLALALLPAAVTMAQHRPASDSKGVRMEVTGCVKGSVLTQTHLRISGSPETDPSRRWRLRGPKALMKQLKARAGEEVQIVGTTKPRDTGMVIAGKRVGKTNVYIGGNPNPSARDPLPEQPTIDVESFEVTGEKCR